MKKIYLWAIVIVIAAGGSFGGYAYFSKENNSSAKYRTAKIERGIISTFITSNGTVTPVTTVSVGTQVSGTIQQLFADFNSPVKDGQLIALIDPTIFQAQVSQAQAKLLNSQAAALTAQADVATAQSNLESSKANVIKAQVSVTDTKRSLDRSLELFRQNLISASDRDAAQTAYDSAVALLGVAKAQQKASETQIDSAKARLESARAGIKQSQADLQVAQANLDHTRIFAPVTGIVISRNVDVGQTVAASLQAPTLFTIAKDLTQMEVDTNISEADIGRISMGQECTFTVDAYPNITFNGRVTEVRNAPISIQNVVTYTVVIQVGNPDLKLKPGMTANASILVARKDNILKIPNAALRFRPDFANKATTSSPKAAVTEQKPAPPSVASNASGQNIRQSIAALNLSPEQQAKVSQILRDAQVGRQATLTSTRSQGSMTKTRETQNRIGPKIQGEGPTPPSTNPDEVRVNARETQDAIRQKIRAVLNEEQKKKFDQMNQGTVELQTPAPRFRVWTLDPQGNPVSVQITTGISDWTFTEVLTGNLTEGQEVLLEASGSGTSSQTNRQGPPRFGGGMGGFELH